MIGSWQEAVAAADLVLPRRADPILPSLVKGRSPCETDDAADPGVVVMSPPPECSILAWSWRKWGECGCLVVREEEDALGCDMTTARRAQKKKNSKLVEMMTSLYLDHQRSFCLSSCFL